MIFHFYSTFSLICAEAMDWIWRTELRAMKTVGAGVGSAGCTAANPTFGAPPGTVTARGQACAVIFEVPMVLSRSPLDAPPPPTTKTFAVGNNEIYNWENLIGPFLVHTILGPRPPPPPNAPFKHRPGPGSWRRS